MRNDGQRYSNSAKQRVSDVHKQNAGTCIASREREEGRGREAECLVKRLEGPFSLFLLRVVERVVSPLASNRTRADADLSHGIGRAPI